jgi:hypothetical protein
MRMSGNLYESPTTDCGSPHEHTGDSQKRLSLGIVAVVVNFILWHVGIYFDSFDGWIDRVGATICVATYGLAWILIPMTIVYCLVRRFVLPVRKWDLYGPALAVIFVLVMYWQLETNVRM